MTPQPPTPEDVWSAISDLVLDNERRKQVSAAVGLSFGRVRAVRRLVAKPLSMSELAIALGIDAPNATTVVDDLESLGLVRRRPHPTDRRAKLVELTTKGRQAAKRANAILHKPPAGLTALKVDDLQCLAELVSKVASIPD